MAPSVLERLSHAKRVKGEQCFHTGTCWWYQADWREPKFSSKFVAFSRCALSRSGRAISEI
jgi:hypothetical protein